ncbi:DEAD/DEAH box helicase family protein [Rhizobium sp. WYCCWR 11279]|uniref:DEAD/DEAH box helicase family protein n=1 Tax=Rhizobium changzhiense TaxID=2692317 RepID=UPI0014927E82|nr:DEAD/DEAH box helicase family protein [Rhizobium changzhiense]NNU46288.1 DEAD/DEAH box helicase family protein [Rhizobium changzhiense]
MLRQLTIKGVYKSDEDNILEDFYMPALAVAYTYDRAVGFFSAATLSYAAQAISAFIRNGGKMRLVLGAFCDEEDIQAVSQGLRDRELSERIGGEFLKELDRVDDALFHNRFEGLAWLVAKERLEIKVALRPKGMYHDKIGIISDTNGDSVVFSGSANESLHALLPTHNYESIDVFPSWRAELEPYYRPHKDSFERLWSNRSRNTAVLDVPEAIKERLLSIGERLHAPPDPERELAIARRIGDRDIASHLGDEPRVPEIVGGAQFKIRDHQREALRSWQLSGEYHGILNLATGAGKTITAAYAATQMAKAIPGLTVIVAVPYQNLADQWCDNLGLFNIRPLRCYVSKSAWLAELQNRILDIELGAAPFTAIVVVNRTLKTPEFQQLIARIPGQRLFWIGDECHHHSSGGFNDALPAQAKFRLGLSATPEHYLDNARNSQLEAYYGEVVFTYSLSQAIQDEVLTPYDYFPHLVELTPSEANEFVAMSMEIGRLIAREGGAEPSLSLKALMMKRARIIGSARNKIVALRQVLRNRPAEAHTLFYCGDGQVETDDSDDANDDSDPEFSGRQIEVISQHLDELGWTLSRFTSHEPRKERDHILANFRIGLIDAMVAIRCLDEGIDVPACKTAYILASSRDPRQFIQRRGRILRRSPGKDVATIHDFVVVLPGDAGDRDGYAYKLIASELRRVAEFAGLSRNRTYAYQTLRPVLVAYGLEHLL